MSLSEKEKEKRRIESFVVSSLARVLNLPMTKSWAIVRRNRLVQIYGKDLCCRVLDNMAVLEIPESRRIPYAMGALRKEFSKTGNFSTMRAVLPLNVLEVLNIK